MSNGIVVLTDPPRIISVGIQGPQGPAGPAGADGSTTYVQEAEPTVGLVEGDFWFKPSSSELSIYVIATWELVSGGGIPGGSTTQLQYNNAGTFGGTAEWTYSGGNIIGEGALHIRPPLGVNGEISVRNLAENHGLLLRSDTLDAFNGLLRTDAAGLVTHTIFDTTSTGVLIFGKTPWMFGTPTLSYEVAPKGYVDGQITGLSSVYLPLTGGVLTGGVYVRPGSGVNGEIGVRNLDENHGLLLQSGTLDGFNGLSRTDAAGVVTHTVFSVTSNGQAYFTKTPWSQQIVPTLPYELTRKDYVDNADALKLDLTGGTVTGQINGITPTAAANLTRKDYVDTAISGLGSVYLPLAGGTLSGTLASDTGVFNSNVPDGASVNGFVFSTPTYVTSTARLMTWQNGAAIKAYISEAGKLITAGGVDKLTTATGTVSVSTAPAPTVGQVLKATSSSAAQWQDEVTVITPIFSEDASFNIYGGTGAGAALDVTGFRNMLMGQDAGALITTGDENIAIGAYALKQITTQTGSVAIGANTLEFGTATGCIAIGLDACSGVTGDVHAKGNLVAVGYKAGQYITTGQGCTLVGVNAGRGESTARGAGTNSTYIGANSGIWTGGSNNTAIGYDAMRSVAGGSASGNGNVAVGAQALFSKTTGYFNVCLGYGSANKITSGGNNVCLGLRAGPTTNQSNKLYIDILETDTPLIYGDFTTKAVTVNGELTATTAKTVVPAILGLSSSVTSGGTYGSVGVVGHNTGVTGSTFGVRGVVDSSTGSPGYFENTATTSTISIGAGNTFINCSGSGVSFYVGAYDGKAHASGGIDKLSVTGAAAVDCTASAAPSAGQVLTALSATTADWQDAAGGAFTLDAYSNLFAGASAGAALTASSTDNFLAGSNCGDLISTGDNNIAIGNNALSNNVAANNCIALGASSLFNATGSNVAIGWFSGYEITNGTEGVYIGNQAGRYANGGAHSNVYIGALAGRGVTTASTGSSNIGIGRNSLVNITTGGSNTILGYGGGAKIDAGNFNICIGYSAGPTTNQTSKLFIDTSERDDPLIGGDFVARTINMWGELVVQNDVATGTSYGLVATAESSSGMGVRGIAGSSTGTVYGVRGETISTSGFGVWGRGPLKGVYGLAQNAGGFGVEGYASATSGTSYGVYGSSNSSDGVGVYGYTGLSSGATIGTVGRSLSTSGIGLYGYAQATTGTTYGVYGYARSATGYAGYFKNNNGDDTIMYLCAGADLMIGNFNTIEKFKVTDVGTVKATGGIVGYSEVANTGTTPTINWTLGQFQSMTITAATTVTLTAPIAQATLTLKIINGGLGVITWPSTVKWPAGLEPVWIASGTDIVTFYFDGTNYQHVSNTVNNILHSGDNVIINGDFAVWQRGTSFAAAASGTVTADRWKYTKSGVVVHTVGQTGTVPTYAESGHRSGLGLYMTVTTADTSITGVDYTALQYRVEGYDFNSLRDGTATISFWVRSSVTGTYCVAFRNSGSDRSYLAEYTIDAVDTYQKITLTVPFTETAGTWNYTNGVGIDVFFTVACGPTLQTTAGAWQTGNFIGTANQVNFNATVGNFFRISQVQLETGSYATPFEVKNYADELARCQRYYSKSYAPTTGPGTITTVGATAVRNSAGGATAMAGLGGILPVTMRDTPTVTWYSTSISTANRVRNASVGTNLTVSSTSLTGTTQTGFPVLSAGVSDVHLIYAQYTADAEL